MPFKEGWRRRDWLLTWRYHASRIYDLHTFHYDLEGINSSSDGKAIGGDEFCGAIYLVSNKGKGKQL